MKEKLNRNPKYSAQSSLFDEQSNNFGRWLMNSDSVWDKLNCLLCMKMNMNCFANDYMFQQLIMVLSTKCIVYLHVSESCINILGTLLPLLKKYLLSW